MTTKFAALNAHPRFSTPPRLCGLPAFPVAPRQNRRFSLPRVEVLVEPSDDSDDDGALLSYHAMRLKRARAPSPDEVDDLEKRKLVSHDSTAAKKKPTDTTHKGDFYIAPLSPLSDLTESDTSDSDGSDDVLSTATSPSPPSKSQAALVAPRITDARAALPPSSGLKRQRSSTPDVTAVVKDSEGPSKRRRRTSGTSEQTSGAEARRDFSMSPGEIKKSMGRHGKTCGTVRKPRVMRSASFR